MILRLTGRAVPRLARSIRTISHCPSCNTPLPTALPTCPKCKYIAPLPSSMSYYQYFNIPNTESNPFSIDTRDLRRRFLQTQQLCHPDIWAQKSPGEQALAAAQSAQLNKAYETLLSPLDRAYYILSLHGIKESETEKLEDKELLMQVMEARQEVEEASSDEDIRSLNAANKERIDETVREIEDLIGKQNWEQAKRAIVKLKYWLGIENAAKESAYG